MREGRALRVLITVPSLEREFGGPPAVARALAAHLRERGANPRVIGVGDDDEAEGEGLSELLRFHGTPVPSSIRPLMTAVRRADVVHVLGFRDPVGIVAMTSALGHTPILLEPSGMHRPRIRSLQVKRLFDRTIGRRLVASASIIIATSELERRELESDGVDRARIRVRPVGLPDLEGGAKRSVDLRTRFGIEVSAPLVINVGRITAKKGLADLITAVSGLEGLHLVIAGPSDSDGTLESLIERRRRLGSERRIHLLPEGLWGAEKLEAFRDAACFALPSRTENFGIAVAEAAAVGLPVIVSDRCGVAEYLSPEATIVVRAADVGGLRDAIERGVHDVGLRRAATAWTSHLRRDLDWGRLVDRQLQIYEEALGMRRSSGWGQPSEPDRTTPIP